MNQAYVVCRVEGTQYAIPADEVQQLEMVEEITRVPGASESLDGVVYLRGQVVPVLSLRRRMGLPRIAYDLSARLVIVRLEQRVVALAVDSASEFASFPPEACQPPPEALAGQDYLAGVIAREGRLILVLNVRCLLQGEKEHG